MGSDRCDLLCLDLEQAEKLRAGRIDAGVAAIAAAAAKALSDPTRLMLAVALRDGGELCVCDLSWIAERAENLVSHHVRALRDAGLVDSRRNGRMVLYRLNEHGHDLLAATMSNEHEHA